MKKSKDNYESPTLDFIEFDLQDTIASSAFSESSTMCGEEMFGADMS
jgi:hypothetical protein